MTSTGVGRVQKKRGNSEKGVEGSGRESEVNYKKTLSVIGGDTRKYGGGHQQKKEAFRKGERREGDVW